MSLLGQRWSLLIVREALLGRTRFSEFREQLGVASDVLTVRLGELVAAGVLRQVDYQDAGERMRHRYELTDAGRELSLVLSALGQWGWKHVERADSSAVRFVDTVSGDLVAAGFRDRHGRQVRPRQVGLVYTDEGPGRA
jgi:DNA-binding HxlR family transcriptional regulator